MNLSIPTIMLRRLAAGKIDLASTVKCRELRERICGEAYRENLFVLYGEHGAAGTTTTTTNAAAAAAGDSVLAVLMRRLTQDGCRVACLEGECDARLFIATGWREGC